MSEYIFKDLFTDIKSYNQLCLYFLCVTAQVNEIKKTKLSLIMCKNLDFPFIQRYALFLPSQT